MCVQKDTRRGRGERKGGRRRTVSKNRRDCRSHSSHRMIITAPDAFVHEPLRFRVTALLVLFYSPSAVENKNQTPWARRPKSVPPVIKSACWELFTTRSQITDHHCPITSKGNDTQDTRWAIRDLTTPKKITGSHSALYYLQTLCTFSTFLSSGNRAAWNKSIFPFKKKNSASVIKEIVKERFNAPVIFIWWFTEFHI